jgi:signal transduction histidine kinase
VKKKQQVIDEVMTLQYPLANVEGAEREHKEAQEELKKAYERFLQAQEDIMALDEMKRNILVHVIHDFRNPLTIAMGAVELAMDEKDPERRDELLKSAMGALVRQDFIIVNLLEVTKHRIHTRVLKRHMADMGHTITRVSSEFEPLLAKDRLELTINVEKDLPRVRVDHETLKLILGNLINNAIKFNKKGGKIIVDAARKNDMIEVSISDTGIGIPEEKLGKIFDSFYQVGGSQRRFSGGLGLGLSIVKKIIESHGGEISVKSEVDKGSSFCFTLPMVREV